MLGLTSMGVVHTAISLVALVSGFWALGRYRFITANNGLGKVYLVSTALTAATGLFIFQHGGFGPPHALSIMTLLALALGAVASRTGMFGKWWRYVEALAHTTTVFFHMIPGFTETLTRLPLGAPVLPNADAPQFGPIYGALFLLLIGGLVLQFRWLKSSSAAP